MYCDLQHILTYSLVSQKFAYFTLAIVDYLPHKIIPLSHTHIT
jgi:hypothetical protein